MKEAFISHRFSDSSLDTLGLVNGILTEYEAMGYRLSLRQLYYQLVARGHIENSQRSYKNIGNLVSTGRQAGYIDWDMIEDRGRETVSNAHWNNPGEIALAAARQFKIDKWADQDIHIEVMVEKDALSGVLEPVCRRLDVAITANKGYSSSSTMYEIGKRLAQIGDAGKDICIFYLGDHDPSGIDMTRDVTERLAVYSRIAPIDVERLALNYDQVMKWRPPENPAKETDARYQSYVIEFGESSWELDAVEPRTLAGLVENAVIGLRDDKLWDQAVERENAMKRELEDFAERWL